METDHGFRDFCKDPTCTVCALFPVPGEDREVWAARVKAQWHGEVPPVMAERLNDEVEEIEIPSPAPSSLADKIAAKVADLEQQEKDAVRAFRAAQEQLVGIRGGLAALREIGASPGQARVRALPSPPSVVATAQAATLGQTGRRWSRDYDRCQSPDCRTPNAPHCSKGRCRTCYTREIHRAKRGSE